MPPRMPTHTVRGISIPITHSSQEIQQKTIAPTKLNRLSKNDISLSGTTKIINYTPTSCIGMEVEFKRESRLVHLRYLVFVLSQALFNAFGLSGERRCGGSKYH